MRIESLSKQPDRVGRFAVKFDDGTSMRLYRQTVEDFGLYTGMELSEEEMASLRSSAGQLSAKMRAVRIVSASGVSKSDLERRLIQKGEDPSQAREAVRWMSDLDLLDDAKTATQIVHSCVSKGYGIARAKQALYEKRIPKQYWDAALRDYPDQNQHILSYLRSKLHDSQNPKELRKVIDALQRRGHSYRDIRRALDQLDLCTDEFQEEY